VAERQLIALVEGRAFTIRLAEKANIELAFDYLSGRGGRGHGAAPDAALRYDWLDTEEGFRIRADAIAAIVIGHKQGEWAVAGEAD
jgi:hypothetical protein